MGKLHYGAQAFEMDDRLLAHLQLIMGVKLRRGENFFMAWKAPEASGNGRRAIWIDNGVHLYFEYSGGREPNLNLEWAERLVNAAGKGRGLIIMAEDLPMMPDDEERDPTPLEQALADTPTEPAPS